MNIQNVACFNMLTEVGLNTEDTYAHVHFFQVFCKWINGLQEEGRAHCAVFGWPNKALITIWLSEGFLMANRTSAFGLFWSILNSAVWPYRGGGGGSCTAWNWLSNRESPVSVASVYWEQLSERESLLSPKGFFVWFGTLLMVPEPVERPHTSRTLSLLATCPLRWKWQKRGR